jgi:hypothetical protein
MLGLAMVAALSGPAWSVKLEACQFDSMIGEFSHRDLGGGVVAFVEGVHDHDLQQHTLVVVACRSGQRLDVPMNNESWETKNKFDRYERVAEMLEAAEASATPYDLEGLAEMYRAEFGPDAASLSTDPDEKCACAIEYPSMRGNKNKFEPWW